MTSDTHNADTAPRAFAPMKIGIGKPASRLEDLRLLRGEGQFVDDIRFENQAEAWLLRSPVAHGTITKLDISAAREAPGVLAVYTQEMIDAAAESGGGLRDMRNNIPLSRPGEEREAQVPRPCLARGKVRYVGDPIVFIVAESREQARDAGELIEVEFDEHDIVLGVEAALASDAPKLHEEAPGNLSYVFETGDEAGTERAFEDAAHRIKLRVRNQRLVINPIEPRAINANYDQATGRWEIWCVSQGVHGMRNQLCTSLGVESDKIRLRTRDVGGGFGMKLMIHPEYALCAYAARDCGRAVKWTGDRSESFLSDAQGRDLTTDIEGAFDAGGTLLGVRATSWSNLGACYSQVGAAIHSVFSANLLGSVYRVPVLHHRVWGAFTNTVPTDAFRGAGRPEVIYCTERLIAQAAIEMGMDPTELRLKNLLTSAEMPHTSPGGLPFDSMDPAANIRKVAEMGALANFPARAAAAKARGKHAGMALIYYMERSGGGPNENARIEMRADGTVRILTGTQTNGQGHETAWAQIVHQELGMPLERIEVAAGDSDALPPGGGTGGSRSLIMAGRSLLIASADVREKARQKAAEHLEAAVADIEFSASDTGDGGGRFSVAGTDRRVSLLALMQKEPFEGVGAINTSIPSFPNGAHLCEVEIDAETGRAELTRYTIVDDFGRILNPELAGGQVHGGVAQGVGQAMMEEAVWDAESGQPLSGSFMDYTMPRADDFPQINLSFNENEPCRTNWLGAKGCGEAGTVGGIPAAAIAVQDALLRAGAPMIETPMTPLRIWNALQNADAKAH